MADPVLDEDGIIALLSTPINPQTSEAVEAGAVQLMMDMFDRKCDRREFASHVGMAVTLYASCSRLQLLNSIREVWEAGNLNEQRIGKAYNEITDLIRAQQVSCVAMMERLKQCPTSQDKLH